MASMRRWRQLSIRWRITIGSVLVGAVLLTGAGLLFRAQIEQAQINSDKKILYGASTPYVAQVRRHPAQLDPPSGEERLVVLDPAGSSVASNLPDPLSDRLRELSRLSAGSHFARYEGVHYLLVVRVVPRDDGDWRIVAARDESTTTDVVMANLTGIIVIGGGALLVGFGVASWLLTTAALRPVSVMRRRAQSLDALDSDELLPVPPSRDELSELATTLNALLERMRAAAAREKQVVADASHELRTPITVLRGQVELAKRHPGDPDRLLDVEETTARLSDLAVNLLALSTLEGERAEILATSVELAEGFQASAQGSRILAEAQGAAVAFAAETPAGSGSYPVSPTDLGRVVDNLVRNALTAGGAGTTVAVRLRMDADRLELVVEDDGPGMPAEFLPTATDRFTRASTTAEGAGLGLAIVRRIAERASGTLLLANVAPHGLCVTLTIPGRHDGGLSGVD